MKIKYPKKKKKYFANFSLGTGRKQFGVFILFIAFILGMLFYRSGYPSFLLASLRESFKQQDPKDILQTELDTIQNELIQEIKLYDSNGLATVFLDIPFSSMQQIEAKREEALEIGILLSEDDDYVPGSVRYNNGESMEIKLRLKGDWTDHLEGDKWSFRVHVKDGEGALLGMRRFSLQSPETRNFVNEWAYHQNLQAEGILTTRYHFVNVVLNGEYKGIYALEESFTEDLLESQGRREGVIIRLNEDFLWSNWARFEKDDLFDITSRSMGIFLLTQSADSSEITPFRGSRIKGDDVLFAEAETAIELLYGLREGLLSHSEVLDEELWGKYYAITDLWGAGHGTNWHNERFYYNPITGLLEPVAFDGDVLNPSFSSGDTLAEVFEQSPFFMSTGIQKKYLETLEEIIKPAYRLNLEEQLGADINGYTQRILEEYEGSYPDLPGLELPWEHLEARSEMFLRNLDPYQPLRGNYSFIEKNGQSFLKVDLVNLMILPVQVEYVSVGDDKLEIHQEWCLTDSCDEKTIVDDGKVILFSPRQNGYSPISFLLPVAKKNVERWQRDDVAAEISLYGSERTFNVSLYDNYVPTGIDAGVKPSRSLNEVLTEHSFLRDTGNGNIFLEPGVWDIQGDLVIPAGYSLSVFEGTVLRFGPGSVLLAEGTINIYGKEDAPVYLTAQEETWGGVVVLNAPDESQWQYSVVEKTAGIVRDGWILTGGVTFYESPLQATHAIFRQNGTEDALNIVRSTFSFESVEFSDAPSDAFDGDFVTGTIRNSSFHDVQGDAVDVSGSDILVTDSHFVRIGDKAISAGEKSVVELTNATIKDVSIGIASKDLSHVIASSSTIDGATVAGVTAYIKKDQYGPAIVEGTEITFSNTKTETICQLGSQIMLNGIECVGIDVDVDAMYEQGILGN